MSAMASQITGVSIVCSTVCSGAGQRKHQSSASMAFVKGIHRCRWPMDSPHKGPVTQKMLSFDDVIMLCQCSFTWQWGGWGCEVSCGGHHRPRGKTTTGSAVDGTVFDIAQILAYLVHVWTPMSSVRKKARPINLISLSLFYLTGHTQYQTATSTSSWWSNANCFEIHYYNVFASSGVVQGILINVKSVGHIVIQFWRQLSSKRFELLNSQYLVASK